MKHLRRRLNNDHVARESNSPAFVQLEGEVVQTLLTLLLELLAALVIREVILSSDFGIGVVDDGRGA